MNVETCRNLRLEPCLGCQTDFGYGNGFILSGQSSCASHRLRVFLNEHQADIKSIMAEKVLRYSRGGDKDDWYIKQLTAVIIRSHPEYIDMLEKMMLLI